MSYFQSIENIKTTLKQEGEEVWTFVWNSPNQRLSKVQAMSQLKEIEQFSSWNEFESFKTFLSDRIEEGELKEIEPQEHFFGNQGFYKDRWFKDPESSEQWRLVHPDFPFKGFFKKIVYPLDQAVHH